jgi:hypothetical protein
VINRSKINDHRFWRRWCDSGAVSNIDGLCVDFWMLRRFWPTAARGVILVNGKPLGHVVGFTPTMPPTPDAAAPHVIEAATLTFRHVPANDRRENR